VLTIAREIFPQIGQPPIGAVLLDQSRETNPAAALAAMAGNVEQIYLLGTILGFILSRLIKCDRASHRGTYVMRTLHEGRGKLPLPLRAEKALPIGQSIAVICGLSVLCWGVVVLFIVALRAIV